MAMSADADRGMEIVSATLFVIFMAELVINSLTQVSPAPAPTRTVFATSQAQGPLGRGSHAALPHARSRITS